MRIILKCLLLCLLMLPLSARAEGPSVPNANWFVGLGASANAVGTDQDMYARGTANIFQNGTQVAVGGAGGPANPRHNNQWTLAPEGQFGYMTHFPGSNWLVGAKVLYKYANATASTPDIVPQSGAVTALTGEVIPFTGNVVIGSYRTQLNHQFAFMPFIGHSFARSYVYFGAGPALFGTKTTVDNAVGFALFEGVHREVTGAPVSFASSQWVWGGAAQIGLAYYLADGWFLDVNYTYARSGKFSSNYSAPFSNTPGGYQVIGTLYVSPSQRVIDQSVGITINKGF